MIPPTAYRACVAFSDTSSTLLCDQRQMARVQSACQPLACACRQHGHFEHSGVVVRLHAPTANIRERVSASCCVTVATGVRFAVLQLGFDRR